MWGIYKPLNIVQNLLRMRPTHMFFFKQGYQKGLPFLLLVSTHLFKNSLKQSLLQEASPNCFRKVCPLICTSKMLFASIILWHLACIDLYYQLSFFFFSCKYNILVSCLDQSPLGAKIFTSSICSTMKILFCLSSCSNRNTVLGG